MNLFILFLQQSTRVYALIALLFLFDPIVYRLGLQNFILIREVRFLLELLINYLLLQTIKINLKFMRKFISILCLLIAFAFQSFAEETKEQVNNVQVVNATFDNIEQGLTKLAETLKVPASKMWEVFVEQQMINSLSEILALIITLSICVFVYIKCVKYAEKNNDDVFEYAITGLPAAAVLAVAFISLILILVGATDTITGFINPEYGAIKDIIDAIKLE